MIKFNNSEISKARANGSNIRLIKLNGEIYFELIIDFKLIKIPPNLRTEYIYTYEKIGNFILINYSESTSVNYIEMYEIVGDELSLVYTYVGTTSEIYNYCFKVFSENYFIAYNNNITIIFRMDYENKSFVNVKKISGCQNLIILKDKYVSYYSINGYRYIYIIDEDTLTEIYKKSDKMSLINSVYYKNEKIIFSTFGTLYIIDENSDTVTLLTYSSYGNVYLKDGILISVNTNCAYIYKIYDFSSLKEIGTISFKHGSSSSEYKKASIRLIDNKIYIYHISKETSTQNRHEAYIYTINEDDTISEVLSKSYAFSSFTLSNLDLNYRNLTNNNYDFILGMANASGTFYRRIYKYSKENNDYDIIQLPTTYTSNDKTYNIYNLFLLSDKYAYGICLDSDKKYYIYKYDIENNAFTDDFYDINMTFAYTSTYSKYLYVYDNNNNNGQYNKYLDDSFVLGLKLYINNSSTKYCPLLFNND